MYIHAFLTAGSTENISYSTQKLWALLWWAGLVLLSGAFLVPFTAHTRAKKIRRKMNREQNQPKREMYQRKAIRLDGLAKKSWLGFLMGADGRLSTSKTIAYLWALLVAYILIALLVVWPADWDAALKNLDGTYYALLGGPFAAVVLAKGIVATRVRNNSLQKGQGDGTPTLADLFGNDSGSSDLFDVQYVMFNVIAIAFVLIAFSKATLSGFPPIPNGLILLTAGPAAVYLANKTVVGNRPMIFSVTPARVKPGEMFTVFGENFAAVTTDGQAPGQAGQQTPDQAGQVARVLVDGCRADVIAGTYTDTSVQATAPDVGRDTGHTVPVSVITPAGAQAYRDGAITVLGGTPALDALDKATAGVGENLTLTGTWQTGSNGDQPATFLVDSVVARPVPGAGLTDHAATVVVPTLANLPPAPSGRVVEVIVVDESGRSDPKQLSVHQ